MDTKLKCLVLVESGLLEKCYLKCSKHIMSHACFLVQPSVFFFFFFNIQRGCFPSLDLVHSVSNGFQKYRPKKYQVPTVQMQLLTGAVTQAAATTTTSHFMLEWSIYIFTEITAHAHNVNSLPYKSVHRRPPSAYGLYHLDSK